MARGVPSTVFLPFCFPLRRNSPVGQRSGVRLQPCGKGRHRRLKPTGLATDMHAVTCGFDSRNRLSSDTSKAGRIHAVAHPRIRPGANPPRVDARPPSDCPGRKRWRRNAGNAFRPHPAVIAQMVEQPPRKRQVAGSNPARGSSRMRQRRPPQPIPFCCDTAGTMAGRRFRILIRR